MGFPKRKFQAYDPVGKFSIHNDQWLGSPESTKLINNALAVHRSALKCIHANLGLTVAEGDTWDKVLIVEPGVNAPVITIPMSGIITGAGGAVRVWIMVTRDDSASSAFVLAYVGRELIKVHLTYSAGAYEWLCLDVPVGLIKSPTLISDLSIHVSVGVDWDYGEGNQETIRVRSLSLMEPKPPKAAAWIDTSGTYNQLFNDDGPLSPAAQRIFNQKLNAAWSARATQQNIFNLCFRHSQKTLAPAFDADAGGQGYWMIRKAQGVDQINFIAWGVDKCDLSLSLWSNNGLNYNAQTVNFVVGDVVVGQTSGATATILADNDAGATGTLAITRMENGIFQAGEILQGRIQGSATMNGAPTGAAIMIAQTILTDVFVAGNNSQAANISGLVTADVEFEVRADVRDPSGGGGGATGQLVHIWAGEDLDAAIDYAVANPMNVEMDDDARALTWRRADSTIDQVWNRQRQTLLNDARQLNGDTGQITGESASVLPGNVQPRMGFGHFLWGVLNQTPGAGRRIYFRANVGRPDQAQVFNIDMNPYTATAAIGDTGTGATSGVTAIVRQLVTPGPPAIITFDGSACDFILGEVINFTSGGFGTVAAVRYRPQIDLTIRIGIAIGTPGGGADVIASKELDVSRVGTRGISLVDGHIDLIDSFEGDISIHGTGGGMAPVWAFMVSYTSNLADYMILDAGRIYEQIIPPGGILMSQEDHDAKS